MSFKIKTISLLKTIYRQLRCSYWSFRAGAQGKLPEITNTKNKILFLLPEAGVTLYIKNLVVLASQLTLQGYQVYFARCFNLFERCMFMDSESLPIEASSKNKKDLCTYCFRTFDQQVIKNNFEYIDLRHFADENDLQEINREIANNPEDSFKYIYDDINFSGLLEYNFLLFLKKGDVTHLDSKELKLWQEYLVSLFVGYKAVKKLINQMQISHVIMSDQYSFNFIIDKLTRKIGIPLVNVTIPYHKDMDADRIKIFLTDAINESHEAIHLWPRFKELSLSSFQIKEVADDLIVKMAKKGVYSYSPAKSLNPDITNLLGLIKNRKTIVAYTSSVDEVNSIINSYKQRNIAIPHSEDAFKDQLEWLDELIAFVENSENFQLVIRLHPRMAPNHREKWGCVDIHDYDDRYSKQYRHVKIIWPQEDISSFDLADIADVVSVAWSSLGIFMARLGIPVISGLKSSLALPDDDFHVFTNTKEEYINKLCELAYSSISYQRLKNAYRYYYMMYLGYSIEVGDVIDAKQNTLNKLSKNAHLLEKAIVKNQNVLEMNLKRLQDDQIPTSEFEENKELNRQIFRIIHFFMTNSDIEPSLDLDFINLKINHYDITYLFQGQTFIKYSPMISRLASLLPEHGELHNRKQRQSVEGKNLCDMPL